MAEDEREQRLRKNAEKLVGADLASLEDLTPDQMHGLIHGLQVHQLELHSNSRCRTRSFAGSRGSWSAHVTGSSSLVILLPWRTSLKIRRVSFCRLTQGPDNSFDTKGAT